MTCRLRGIAVAGLLGLGATSLMEVGAHAEQGVFDDRILFGQSAAFDGPAAALGLGMREGILASFNEANAAGGINGYRLELVSYSRRRFEVECRRRSGCRSRSGRERRPAVQG
jgi:branched-chain amino acid transport system substrate-binding protein